MPGPKISSTSQAVITGTDGDQGANAVNRAGGVGAGNVGAKIPVASPPNGGPTDLAAFQPKQSTVASPDDNNAAHEANFQQFAQFAKALSPIAGQQALQQLAKLNVESTDALKQAEAKQNSAPASKSQPVQTGQSSASAEKSKALSADSEANGTNEKGEIKMDDGTKYIVNRYKGSAIYNTNTELVDPYTNKAMGPDDGFYFFVAGVNKIYRSSDKLVDNESNAEITRQDGLTENELGAVSDKGGANAEAAVPEKPDDTALAAGAEAKDAGKNADRASATSSGGATQTDAHTTAASTAAPTRRASIQQLVDEDHLTNIETWKNATNLRTAGKGAEAPKPFKELDWVDRHHIWLSRRGKFLGALSWLTGVGTYRNIKAHMRYGWSDGYKSTFAQMLTPDGPSESAGLFYQEQEVDPKYNQLHALHAVLGEKYNLDTAWYDKRLKSHGKDGSLNYLSLRSTLKSQGFEVQGFDNTNLSARTDRSWRTKRPLHELYQENITRGHDRVLVGVKKRGWFGREKTEWVAFRKNNGLCAKGASAPADDKKSWSLIDAKRFVIDSSNECQPNIDPGTYIKLMTEKKNVTGLEFVLIKRTPQPEDV